MNNILLPTAPFVLIDDLVWLGMRSDSNAKRTLQVTCFDDDDMIFHRPGSLINTFVVRLPLLQSEVTFFSRRLLPFFGAGSDHGHGGFKQ